jgi:phosphatidylglycerophosphate synthase
MLTTRYKAVFNRLVEPPARLLVRWGVSPSVVTLSGLALVIASCAFLLMTRQVVVFCVLVTAASLMDALDGAVARVGGRASKRGSYLDALCDRYGEAIVVGCVAVVTGYWGLSMLVVVGALLVSYAKARAAMEVPISNTEWPDLMERTERAVIYIAGLAAGQLLPWKPFGHDLFWWTLVLLSALIHATVIQRILRARRLIQSREGCLKALGVLGGLW